MEHHELVEVNDPFRRPDIFLSRIAQNLQFQIKFSGKNKYFILPQTIAVIIALILPGPLLRIRRSAACYVIS
jgi:hypothetical protein